MEKHLSEEELLEQLEIEDFRHLSKDTVMDFASSIQYMDPKVAKKALKQFPNFAQAVIDGVAEYKEVAEQVIKSGNSNHDKLLNMIDEEHKQLVKLLVNDDLSLKEKFRIMDELRTLQESVEKVNKEMRNYRLMVAGGVGALILVGIVGIVGLVHVLGGNSDQDRF